MKAIRNFLSPESASGLLLMVAAALALILDNSPLSWLYDELLIVPFEVRLGEFQLQKPLLLWINDGLMAIFFLLIGLEIKREVLEGELASFRKSLLPLFAAVGGMVVPAALFAATNWGEPTIRGWAIPAATDIAFALGILALLGSRVPVSLKIFLTAVAILDDLAAIIIIALFYTGDLSGVALGLAGGCGAVLLILNRFRVQNYTPYLLIGAILWICVLKSGVHATLAGVVIAFAIPLRSPDGKKSPLHEMEHSLHPWVAFMIMPIFAFANAGVSLQGLSWRSLLEPLPLGIALGLFVGKQLGVFSFTWIPVKLGLASRPSGSNWGQIYGVSLLSGIGFTMSLFIGTLAFDDVDSARGVRVGVLSASILSACLGFLVLILAGRNRPPEEAPPAKAPDEIEDEHQGEHAPQ